MKRSTGVGHLGERIAERDGGWFCHYCGRALLDFFPEVGPGFRRPLNAPMVDHRTPKCRGGPDALWNLVLSCQRCNQRKATRSYLEVRWEGLGLGLRPILARAGA